jgi:ectoine hydroxylase-related dioxygenase (phytanoyl-CoA dioxygenase family)
MDGNLDPEGWRQRYEESGYLVVENAVDPGLLGEIRDALERIERAVAEDTLSPNLRRWITLERDRIDRYTDRVASTTISNIMEVPLFDPVFRDVIIYPPVLDILEVLFGSTEFSFHNYKCICKMPGGEAPFQWHRDLPYLEHTSPNLITCMLCIDPMTAENGATVVCPGSHRIPYADVQPDDMDMPEAAVPVKRVTVECPAGSAVLFHINLVHGVAPTGA